MRTFFILPALALLLHAIPASAQIPNAGFEQLNSKDNVSNWGKTVVLAITIDSLGRPDSMAFDGPFYAPTSDAHSGQRAMEMRNMKNVTANQVYTGGANLSQDSTYDGFMQLVPFSGRPASFSFYYKFTPVNGDSAMARVSLYNEQGDELGKAFILIHQQTTAYTLASAPLVYTSNESPASISISFSNYYSVSQRQASLGTRFIVDDVALSGTTGIGDPGKALLPVSIYPNPAAESISANLGMPGILLHYRIYSSTGMLVQQSQGRSAEPIGIATLPVGIYHLELETSEGMARSRFIKN